MRLDIKTIIFITSLLYGTQTLAVFVQYRLNKTYSGLGWWLAGAVLQALGFFLMLALTFRSIWMIAVFANPLVILGQIFLYIGITKFLDKDESRLLPISFFAVYVAFYFYFILIDNSISGRTTVVSISTAVLSLRIAYTLFHEKKAHFSGSADFIASVFFSYGCFQFGMTVVTLLLPPLNTYSEISQVWIRSTAFIIPIVVSMLWTFGFIIMVNQRLNAANQEEKEIMQMVFNISPDAKSITRLSDGLITDVNAGFLETTGYTRDELIGNSIFDFNIWESTEDRRRFTAELKEKGIVQNKEFIFLRKDRTGFFGTISGRSIIIRNQLHGIEVIQDISGRRHADQKIRSLLAEKELILKEVHHRIKNNMTTINGLLALKTDSLKDPTAIAALKDTASRIQSMMLIYETLYKSTNFIDASVRDYLPPLIQNILSNFPDAESVKVETRIDDFVLDVKRLQQLGIVINELLTNIMKYGFTGRDDKKIRVSATRTDSHAVVIVEDNGTGIPESVGFDNSTGFGLMLVGALTKQLQGAIRIERGKGSKIILEFDI
jgi:PAS domain S-box-containing protein